MHELAIEGLIAKYIKNDSVVAIGTSQLGERFLKTLAVKLEERNQKIQFVPTSVRLAGIASELELPIASIDEQEIDVAIEFPEQADANYNFLKIDSESLVRDKMIAQSASDMIIILQKEQFVEKLFGKMALEISPFGYKRTIIQLEKLGPTKLKTENNKPVVTESGNYFALTHIDEIYSPEDLEFQAKEIPGVLETGLFVGYADRIIVHSPGLEVKSRIR
ncbi:ribose-5-phosphate isomerase A [Candidatus Micrarchaeota archaeon]|nr:ribose-5-phosphate isomerase A [Candidatus Micrarchaeota archaeon]